MTAERREVVFMSEKIIRESLADAKELDPAERIRVEVARLAKLDQAAYLAERKAVAKLLSIPTGELDKLVEQARPATPQGAPPEPLAPPPPSRGPSQWPARPCSRSW